MFSILVSSRRLYFYPRPPRGERLAPRVFKPRAASISIHALREESDPAGCSHVLQLRHFYPRPPRGERLPDQAVRHEEKVISIHALREESDANAIDKTTNTNISIHALREESDLCAVTSPVEPLYFYPRPPRGERPLRRSHCLRPVLLFLSTPSARRATWGRK